MVSVKHLGKRKKKRKNDVKRSKLLCPSLNAAPKPTPKAPARGAGAYSEVEKPRRLCLVHTGNGSGTVRKYLLHPMLHLFTLDWHYSVDKHF